MTHSARLFRVLHVVSAMNRGGAETLLMNIYRNINRSVMQFDFVSHRLGACDYDAEIARLGGRVFRMRSLGQLGPRRYMRELTRTIGENGPYDVVHAHTDFQGGYVADAAYAAGVPMRICHAHSNGWGFPRGFFTSLLLRYLRDRLQEHATGMAACSKEAADFLFAGFPATIVPNGIDLAPYIALAGRAGRTLLEKELNIAEGIPIIGNIGRFTSSKNHIYLLHILRALKDAGNTFVALLVGDGPLRAKIEEQGERWGLRNDIRFLGVRTDIPELMYAFDVLLLPSLFEGFGIVLLEAQAAGTPCVASDIVPPTTDMGVGLVQYLPLLQDVDRWCAAVQSALQERRRGRVEDVHQAIIARGFGIHTTIETLLRLYGLSEPQMKENAGTGEKDGSGWSR